jgi:hypothetical protein
VNHAYFRQFFGGNRRRERPIFLITFPPMGSRHDIPVFHLEGFPACTSEVVAQNGHTFMWRVKEAEVEVTRTVVVEVGGVLERVEGSRYGTLNKTVAVETCVEVASGN